MSIKSKVLAASAVLTLAGGIAAAAGTAQASSTGCAFTNGCATLHGTDAASHAVAMDAKYKNSHEIVIGYPDVPGDGATSSTDGAALHHGQEDDHVPGHRVHAQPDVHQPCRCSCHDRRPTVTPSGGDPGLSRQAATTLTVKSTTGTVTARRYRRRQPASTWAAAGHASRSIVSPRLRPVTARSCGRCVHRPGHRAGDLRCRSRSLPPAPADLPH